jgi:hypothetical protein
MSLKSGPCFQRLDLYNNDKLTPISGPTGQKEKVENLNFQLAIAESCSPDGCQVKLFSDGRSLNAPYLARMKGRVIVYPGQLVALNMDLAVPEITWRWHRLQVIEARPGGALLDDRGLRQLTGTLAPGLTLDLQPGQVVFTNGNQESACEIHALLLGEQLAQPEQFSQVILPRIEAILANMPAA